MANFSEKVFLDQKLNNWIGYVIFFAIAIVFGYLMAHQLLLGLGLLGVILGLAILLICLLNTEAGLYINMIYSFFIGHFDRLLFYGDLQVGIYSDILIVATFLSLFIRRISLKQSLNQFTGTSVVVVLLILYGYMAIELFNPSAKSFNGWFQSFRKILGTLMLLFISFNVFDSVSRIKRFIAVLFVLCATTAIYGCIQQWHGLFQFELDWVMKDPKGFAQMFMNGEFKKMSTMLGPDTFSLIMGSCSVFFIVIASAQTRNRNKIIVWLGIIAMLLAMSFTQMRTSNAMVVGGIFMFILMTFNKRSTRVFTILTVLIALVLLYGPYTNVQIDRFRSTFAGTQDDSYNVRETNRKRIQPYIYSHPIGGGLGTSGNEGLTYNPGHYLAGFPPDSGFLRKALETGWVGLGIICVLFFLILKSGIHGYFSAKDEEIKMIYAACTSACFSFYVADFTQVAIGQITDIVVYYPLIAVILKLNILTNSSQI